MVIRKAKDSDIELIANLHIGNWKKTYIGLLPKEFLNSLKVRDRIQKWQEYLGKERHMIFVAYEDEKFLGFSACKEDDEIAHCLYLDSLHVSEASRGKGIIYNIELLINNNSILLFNNYGGILII